MNWNVDIYDPLASFSEVKKEYGIQILKEIDNNKQYKAIIIAVAHDEFLNFNFKKYKNKGSIIYDTKSFIN